MTLILEEVLLTVPDHIWGGLQNQILNIHIFIHSMLVSHQVSSVYVFILLKDDSRLSTAGTGMAVTLPSCTSSSTL